MRALVTGATGFIGRRLVDRLRQHGTEVTILARSAPQRQIQDVRLARGDIAVPESLGEAGAGCDRLYHLAALITFDPRRREDLLRVNCQGTSNILAAARRWGIERSVVVSSACTLGLSRSADMPLDESATPARDLVKANPYLDSKLAAEREAIDAAARGQTVTIVNPTTVYGPGDWSLNSGTLVAKVARATVLPVPPGGSNVVDVDDVVAGILAAGERGMVGERYVLGGANLRFSEILVTIAAVAGRRPLMIPVSRGLRAVASLSARAAAKIIGSRFLTPQIVGDLFDFKYYTSDKARRELRWTPCRSFSESLSRAWAFYRQEGLI